MAISLRFGVGIGKAQYFEAAGLSLAFACPPEWSVSRQGKLIYCVCHFSLAFATTKDPQIMPKWSSSP